MGKPTRIPSKQEYDIYQEYLRKPNLVECDGCGAKESFTSDSTCQYCGKYHNTVSIPNPILAKN